MLIIGEKINASIPRIGSAIRERNADLLIGVARAQIEAGAKCIDVNVGTGEGRSESEAEAMIWLVETLKAGVEAPLCIDSADPPVIEAGLKAAGDRAGFINSVKATRSAISAIMPLAARYGSSIVALAVGEEGIPRDAEGRLRECEKLAEAARQHDIGFERVYFDPLCLPVSTDSAQGMVTIESLSEIKKRIPGAKTLLAASNVSYGLPQRTWVNRAMVQAAMMHDVDAVIMNPLDKELMASVLAAAVVLGRDRHCRKFLKAVRSGILKKEDGS